MDKIYNQILDKILLNIQQPEFNNKLNQYIFNPLSIKIFSKLKIYLIIIILLYLLINILLLIIIYIIYKKNNIHI